MRFLIRMRAPNGQQITYESEWHREGLIRLGQALQAEAMDVGNQALGVDVDGDAIRVRPFKGSEQDLWNTVHLDAKPLS
jgi:hypothetical protein